MGVAPGVVANRFDRIQYHAWSRSGEVERPQALRRIGFDAHHGEAAAVRQGCGRILALARRGEPDARLLLDVVPVDVRLTVLADRRIEERATIRQEVRLVVVARPGRDVDGHANAD